jgi:CspA family cold shock protein
MATGKVKRFDANRGFGFIVPDGGGEDVFVHHSELQGVKSLSEGQRVEYEVVQGPKGPKASGVRLVA